MILMNLKLDNILSFHDFEINFSYPVKLRKTTIKDEFISNISSFRYKKVNIFIGANASGKTSLMKAIYKTLLFLKTKNRVLLDDITNTLSLNSYIELDLVEVDTSSKNYLVRVKIKINNTNNKILVSINKILLNMGDSYESKKSELDSLEDNFEDYACALNKFDLATNLFVAMPATESGFDSISFYKTSNKQEKEEHLEVLNAILKTLDTSILSVKESLDSPNAYVISHEDLGKIIIQDGYKLSSINNLSSGTKYAINIANMIFSLKKHKNDIYIMDEQFSYLNSDLEIAIINTLVSLLSDNEQLFITTHNSNVLDIRFPFHTFNFMKKEKLDGKIVTKSLSASLVENRNNVSAKSILDNDMLAVLPNLNGIFELGE